MDEMNKTVFVNTEVENEADGPNDLDQLYLELGRAYYEGGFEDPIPQLLPLFDEITKLVQQKETEQQESVTDETICPQCGADILENAKFCAVCGIPLDIKSSEEPARLFCRQCGKEMNSDAVFCCYCGTPANNGK